MALPRANHNHRHRLVIGRFTNGGSVPARRIDHDPAEARDVALRPKAWLEKEGLLLILEQWQHNPIALP
jgi:hypothetical protein